MKRNKWNAGYTLIEVLVAISILGIIVSPVCANLVMSLRVNNKTDEMLQAQLAVSSAVETLMAEGIAWEDRMGDGVIYNPNNIELQEEDCYYDDNPAMFGMDRFAYITVETWRERPGDLYYKVEVKSETVPSVSVTTYIHAVEEIPETALTAPTSPAAGG